MDPNMYQGFHARNKIQSPDPDLEKPKWIYDTLLTIDRLVFFSV